MRRIPWEAVEAALGAGEVFPAKQADESPGNVVWLNGQRNWDLWLALQSETARGIETIEPVGA